MGHVANTQSARGNIHRGVLGSLRCPLVPLMRAGPGNQGTSLALSREVPALSQQWPWEKLLIGAFLVVLADPGPFDLPGVITGCCTVPAQEAAYIKMKIPVLE